MPESEKSKGAAVEEKKGGEGQKAIYRPEGLRPPKREGKQKSLLRRA